MARVLLFGAGWVVVVAAVAATVGSPARHGTPRPVRDASLSRSASAAPAPRAGMRFPGWTVTRSFSAHHVLIVDVEADRLTDDLKIAAQIVEPLKARYDEALIYFRLPGQPGDHLAPRRVQWTARAGYVESIYAR
jgi:hypothetical protein